MTMPRTVSEIDRLREALKISQARQLELRCEIEDMRAERNEALALSTMHSKSAARSAREMERAIQALDEARDALNEAEDRIAELEEERE